MEIEEHKGFDPHYEAILNFEIEHNLIIAPEVEKIRFYYNQTNSVFIESVKVVNGVMESVTTNSSTQIVTQFCVENDKKSFWINEDCDNVNGFWHCDKWVNLKTCGTSYNNSLSVSSIPESIFNNYVTLHSSTFIKKISFCFTYRFATFYVNINTK